MKKRSSNILAYFFCFSASLLFLSCGNKFDWYKTYQDEKNHVYGTYILKRYLDEISGNGKTDISRKLSKYFDADEDRNGNYIFVGEAMLIDEFDADALASFVERGNKAFIATNVFPNTISKKIFEPCRDSVEPEKSLNDYEYEEKEYNGYNYEEYENIEYTEVEDGGVVDTAEIVDRENWEYYAVDHINFLTLGTDVVDMKLANNSNEVIHLDSIYRTVKNQEPRYRNWYYLHDSLACLENNNARVLGQMNDTMINFFEVPYGEGAFYIHSSPFVFTNINLLNDKTSAYIDNILRRGTNDPWHWDEYSRTTVDDGRSRNENSTLLSNKGPLTYILKQKSLKWAWYSLLAMGGFFLVFRAKRKQRVVPVVEKNENTSLAFINTIGTLYFNKSDHKQLCKDQMQLWLEDVRHHYRINTSKLDEDFVALLSAKTKKSKKEIQGLLDYYNNIVNGGYVSENTMVTFYQKLNKFDIQTKS